MKFYVIGTCFTGGTKRMKVSITGASRILNNCNGQSLIEYSLILILIAVLLVVSLREFGTSAKSCLFEPVDSAISKASNN